MSEYLPPDQMREILEQFGRALDDNDSEDDTEKFAKMAAENIKFILQKDLRDLLECATHKVNNYRGIIGTIISEESAFPRTSNMTTGEQLLIHICYSLLRELKDVLVWNAFHQKDEDFRDWLVREVFDVEIRVEQEVLQDDNEDDEDEDDDEGDNEL